MKMINGLFWSFLQISGQFGIQFITGIILARILLPYHFGLIAMIWILVGIGRILIDSGFGQALIQLKTHTYLDECSVFYFNLLLGIIMAGSMCLSASFIAKFYNQAILIPITKVMSLSHIINSFGLIHTTLLAKKIDFKTKLKVNIIASSFSGIIGITMAINNFGVWSLVTQSLGNDLLRTIFLWVFHDWRPSIHFSFTSLKQLAPFSFKLLVSGLIDTLFKNAYIIAIGRLFSPVSLGFYSKAFKLKELPVSVMTGVINQVSFPVFSKIQDDKERLKRGVQKTLKMLVLINFPLMIGLIVMAKTVVIVLLTDKWLPSVPYLQLLCIVGLFYPLHVINLNVLLAQGRSDLFLKLEILKKIIIISAIALTFRFGIIAMIYGQIVSAIINYYLNSFYTGKLLQYSILEQVQNWIPTLFISGLMGGVLYLVNMIPISNLIFLMILQIIIAVIVYVGFCYLFKLTSFLEILTIIKQKNNKVDSDNTNKKDHENL